MSNYANRENRAARNRQAVLVRVGTEGEDQKKSAKQKKLSKQGKLIKVLPPPPSEADKETRELVSYADLITLAHVPDITMVALPI